MGEIVAAMGTVHAPQLITRPPEEDQGQLDATIAAMARLGDTLDETKPDALLLVGLDYLESFFLDTVPAFALVGGQAAHSAYASARHEVAIHQPLATALHRELIADGFDISYAQDVTLGHAFATPLEYAHAGRAIPIVPMFVNVYLPPMPTHTRCLALGRAIARIAASRPERVAILASGGMSHYPGTWKYYNPEFEFDRWAIERMEQGDIDSVATLTPEQLDEVGNTELLTWFVMFGAIGSRRGELLGYQPTSHHGHGVMRFIPERSSEPPQPVQERYGGFVFKNQGLEFYKYPDSALYPVHKLLFDLKENEALRERFLEAMDEVSAEYGLTPPQADAMRALDVVPLVELGVHQILGLSSLLVVRQHKARLEAADAR